MAVDGPSGTGKSTVSRKVAAALNAGYLDTGAMYRIVTLAVLNAGIDPADEVGVANLLPSLMFASPVDPAEQVHTLAGEDVGRSIRSVHVTTAVSEVSANPAVREWLKERQQQLAGAGRMVVEGRDIGTVIAPDAALKIYLTASEEVRASRRYKEVGAAGRTPDLAVVRAAIAHRDNYDSNRLHAPLQAAADAIVIDSTDLDIAQSVEAVLVLAAQRGIRWDGIR
ncbi:(d)CMP kinase [Nakamurella antarctica]|uniref:Cytidylate kinase n=1 Tax=Nakamurella antarctica TaxID=1902245 RepID=A0A3G8ZQ65_9ACTN|nr:(d)CMP kinase [Nakamurella antarctica]